MPAIEPTIEQIFQFSDSGNTSDALDIEPIHAKDKLSNKADNYAALREWTQNTIEAMGDSQSLRTTQQIKNLALWTSIQWASQTRNGDFASTNNEDITIDSHKIVVNNIYDIERNRYSKVTRNQPQTRPSPRSNDYDDYVGARIADVVLKTAKERCRQRTKINQMVRESFIFGESYMKTDWNRDKGELDPRWEKYIKKLKDGQTKKDFLIDGELVEINKDRPMFIGDHDLEVRLPWTMYVDPQLKPELVEWVIFEDYVHIETAKMLWPKKAKLLEENKNKDGYARFNSSTLYIETLRNHIQVRTVYVRSGKFLSQALRFVCTDEVMLEAPDDAKVPMCHESEWGDLPIERLTDIDIPGRLHGGSTIQILANLQHTENQMLTMIKHYLLMLGHPKMLIPKEGKIEIDELSDGGYVINYSNGQAPSLMVPNPVPPQVVQLAEYVRDKMQKLGDLHGVSSGDLPSNVKAARAIRLLQELEDLRATSVFTKYNDLYLALDRKILLQTKNYRQSDNRLIYMMGKGNEFLIEDFDVEVLSKNFQVILEISGMLPQQPSAKVEVLSNMYQMTQGQLFTQEKWAKLFGFESEQEFLDAATISVVKAQRENDKFMKNKEVLPPVAYENHLVEIGEHKILLQSATFSLMPKKLQENLKNHVMAHEFLVFLHMQENPLYKEYVFQTCPWYPLLFKLPPDVSSQLAQQPAPTGQQKPSNSNKPVVNNNVGREETPPTVQ